MCRRCCARSSEKTLVLDSPPGTHENIKKIRSEKIEHVEALHDIFLCTGLSSVIYEDVGWGDVGADITAFLGPKSVCLVHGPN